MARHVEYILLPLLPQVDGLQRGFVPWKEFYKPFWIRGYTGTGEMESAIKSHLAYGDPIEFSRQ